MDQSKQDQAVQRWRRLLLRQRAKADWHTSGVLLWSLPRSRALRELDFPWPSSVTPEAYKRQSGALVSAIALKHLIDFRDKIGFNLAFLEDDRVQEALLIAQVK